MAIGLAWSKIVSMSVMFIVTMLFGGFAERLVCCLKSKGKRTDIGGSLIVHLLNCFAGGLFLGTFLLGLLPEVRELFDAVLVRYGISTHFPVAEACTTIGFFMVIFVEQLVKMYQTPGNKASHTDHCHNPEANVQLHIHGRSHRHQHECPLGVIRGLEEEDRAKPVETCRYVKENGDRVESSLPTAEQTVLVTQESFRPVTGFKSEENNLEFVNDGKYDGNMLAPENERHQVQRLPLDGVRKSASFPYVPDRDANSLGEDHKYESLTVNFSKSLPIGSKQGLTTNRTSGETKSLSLRSIILVIALSMHTLFEGLALGLLDDEASVWTLMIAVTVHKSVIVMALSIQLCKVETNTIKMIYLNLFMFAVMSPVGIAVGTAVTETGNPDDLVTDTASSILQALATGTFLYVTFFEVLNRELEGSPDLRKVLAVMLGFSGIIGLKFLELQGGGH